MVEKVVEKIQKMIFVKLTQIITHEPATYIEPIKWSKDGFVDRLLEIS